MTGLAPEAAGDPSSAGEAGEAKGKRFRPIEHAPKGSGARFSFAVFQNHVMVPSFGQKRPREGGGEQRGANGRIGGGTKYALGGLRKPLKRLVSEKEIKVNSKENPRTFQTIPRIFQGISKKIKGFPRNTKTHMTAKQGSVG